MLHISIENIPHEVVKFLGSAINVLDTLKADLESGTVKAVEAYIPEGTAVVEGAKEILTTAIGGLQALKALGDTPGLTGRLLTLSGQLTNLETASAHEWGTLITWIQTVYNHIKGKK